MRSPQKRETQAGGPGLLKKADEWCTSLLANPRHTVNPSDFLFHVQPLAGLLQCGGWWPRLVVWPALLDMTALLLRAVAEGRI